MSDAPMAMRRDLLARRGDFSGVVAAETALVRLRPDDSHSLVERGIAYGRLGAFDLAKADFDHALALHPGDVNALSHRGLLLEQHGNQSSAMADLRQATALELATAETWANFLADAGARLQLGNLGRR